MSAKDKHKVFRTKEELTTKGSLPSSQEIYDLMHVTTCEHAIQRWKDYWMFCPVCLSSADITFDGEILVDHKERAEIVC